MLLFHYLAEFLAIFCNFLGNKANMVPINIPAGNEPDQDHPCNHLDRYVKMVGKRFGIRLAVFLLALTIFTLVSVISLGQLQCY